MLGRLNHVAIAVPDLEKGARIYASVLGARVSAPQTEAAHGVRVVFVELPNTKIELLEPFGENSPIKAFLEKNPAGGMHHVCYEVADIMAARDRLVAEVVLSKRLVETKEFRIAAGLHRFPTPEVR